MTPPAPVPPALDGLHVLALPAGSDVLALARAWFPEAGWERVPTAGQPAVRPTGARFRGITVEPVATAGALVLAEGVTVTGPHPSDAAAARAMGLPAKDADLYGLPVVTPAGAAVTADLVAGWATAAARRTGGGIVPADRRYAVVPDPASALDLTLWSPVTIAAQDAVPLVRPALSGSRLGPTETPQQGSGAEGFSLTATYEYDGAVIVRLTRSREVPVVLSTLDWREHGPWGYHVTWRPPDPRELELEHPSQLHVVARQRVAPAVARVTATLWRAAGGTVVDAGGFVVPAAELDDRTRAVTR
ncbi:hypothetical protein [Cellulomonas shaoxiangyii]|uniref:Uncharacterized protein n=1 Tax=Cellulomonas shaoxiangyii TaxID=2566013 RepID=A0A4P7SLQ4_9CELL|nr:hypothetical protein [Cellulomonas shaoxiangyii]QCB94881.1 hypothetical protein E5225_16255 [Cellulomonas shaoxiangyii]TGY85110.1 hypothetical protein E5226_08120 [Cellulomonas shaoxiangyii]